MAASRPTSDQAALAHDHPDLVCAVCMQPFNIQTRKPIDIGCHTYCEACILASPSSFRRCPECRAGARNPHINYALMRLLGSLASGSATANGQQTNGHSALEGTTQGGGAQELRHRRHQSTRGGSSAAGASRASVAAQPGSSQGSFSEGGSSRALEALRNELDAQGELLPTGAGWVSNAAAGLGGLFGRSLIPGLGHSAQSSRGGTEWAARRQPLLHTIHAVPLGSEAGSRREGVASGAASAGQGLAGEQPGTMLGQEGLHLSSNSHQLVSAAVSDLPGAVAEARSNFWAWAGPLLGLLYLISPLDMIPDFIPLLGWLDDMVVLGALLYWVVRLARAQQIRREAETRMSPTSPPHR